MLIDRFWAIYDPKDYNSGCIKIRSFEEAKRLNEKKYAIYWTPNEFNGARREENLVKINFCFCDIDGGNKEEQFKRIDNCLQPSYVVESKNGYHCYWEVSDMSVKGFKEIEKGIVRRLGADKHAVDLPRILRVPGYYHWKDPNDPFLVRTVMKTGRIFTEKMLKLHFPLPEEPRYVYKYEQTTELADAMKNPDNWEKIFKLSHIQEGCRNSELTKQVYKAYMAGLRGQALLELAKGLNSQLAKPLPEYEVVSMTRRLV